LEPSGDPLTKDIFGEIYRILQMNVAQFSQLVVLPQAAFDTFLRAKTEARGEVLRAIFKTKFYEDLTDLLESKSEQIRAELGDERVSIGHHILNLESLAQAVPEFEFDSNLEVEFFNAPANVRSRSDKDARLNAIVEAITPDTKADAEEKARIEAQLAPIGEEKTKLRLSIGKIEEKQKQNARLIELQNKKPEIDELEMTLKAIAGAGSLILLKGAVDDINDKIESLEDVDEELEEWNSKRIADRIKVLEPQFKTLTSQVSKNEKINDELEALEAALELANSVADAKKEVPKLQKSLETLEKKIVAQKAKNKSYEAKRTESWVHTAAKALKKGQPCPVCGSKEHPKPVSGAASFDEEAFEGMVAALDELQEEATSIKEEIAEYKPFLTKKSGEAAEIEKKIADVEKQIAKADEVSEKLTSVEEELNLLKENLPLVTAHENEQKAIKNAEDKFESELNKAGLTIEQLNDLMATDEDAIKKRVSDYNSEISGIQAILKQAEYVNLPDSTEALSNKLAEVNEKFNEIKAKLDEIETQLSLSADRTVRINTARQRITDSLNSIEKIHLNRGATLELSKLASGSNPDALSLTNYVLQERLAMILERASLHLLKISNYKFEFKLNEEKGAYRKNAGLGITVIDHVAGRERPAETLSGGETFYASLSLCLGLAEVVKMDKGGIELGTLFIDEGFGSLSQDKLTEVLEVLTKMRDDGRIIGIITHLEDMKAQIPMRLKVSRTSEGPSQVALEVGNEI
jgi:exonuclease SbcC